jgi:selenocysteine lyase/cysteine desulfurase
MAPSAGHDEKLWWEVKNKLAGLLGKDCRKEDLALVSTVTEGNMDCIRVSFHICNHEGEVAKILDSLARLAA